MREHKMIMAFIDESNLSLPILTSDTLYYLSKNLKYNPTLRLYARLTH
jgi:hypothetical protein